MGIRTSGTLTEFTKYLNSLPLRGTNETTKVWFTALRQGRFTPKEQAYLDQRIGPLKTKFDQKLAINAAGLDGPAMTQKKMDTLREIFIEEAPWRNGPNTGMPQLFLTCAFTAKQWQSSRRVPSASAPI